MTYPEAMFLSLKPPLQSEIVDNGDPNKQFYSHDGETSNLRESRQKRNWGGDDEAPDAATDFSAVMAGGEIGRAHV